MSIEQYQRTVNSLDRDIVNLEKEKARAEAKVASEEGKANSIKISETSSAATIRSKSKQIESHREAAAKAKEQSAKLTEKIARKRSQRSDAYIRLQKEQQNEQRKYTKDVEKMKKAYENRIAELQKSQMPLIDSIKHNDQPSALEYDVFVSHAWEDKEDFVDELVDELRKAGLAVWYDTSQLKWGDSMREKIDEGLRHSKFGIVVLSPNYIKEGKYWTKAELNALFQKESVDGKTILPIWHNLTKQQVMNYSSIIADKKAMTTATMTVGEIAKELAALFKESND